jgi:hypothetical protein
VETKGVRIPASFAQEEATPNPQLQLLGSTSSYLLSEWLLGKLRVCKHTFEILLAVLCIYCTTVEKVPVIKSLAPIEKQSKIVEDAGVILCKC